MKEIWKDSISMDGYEVSTLGNVRNKKRRNNLAMLPNGHGYSYVSKKQFGHKTNHYVHRLVAEAFCIKDGDATEVNHKDFNRSNNAVANIEWCTSKQNGQYSAVAGRCKITQKRMPDNIRSREMARFVNMKKVAIVDEEGNYIKIYESITNLSRALGVSISSVSKVVRGETQHCAGCLVVYV